jgi:hypothetical protein
LNRIVIEYSSNCLGRDIQYRATFLEQKAILQLKT